MDIKRCTTSFAAGPTGAGAGDLFPAAHPLVRSFPHLFEPVADYVARRFPQYADAPAAAPSEAPEPAEPKPAAKKTTAPRRSAAKK